MMNSSVKSLVPKVSVPPEPAAVLVLVDDPAAAAPDGLELDFELEPQAATSSTARIASAAAASVRAGRRGCLGGPLGGALRMFVSSSMVGLRSSYASTRVA